MKLTKKEAQIMAVATASRNTYFFMPAYWYLKKREIPISKNIEFNYCVDVAEFFKERGKLIYDHQDIDKDSQSHNYYFMVNNKVIVNVKTFSYKEMEGEEMEDEDDVFVTVEPRSRRHRKKTTKREATVKMFCAERDQNFADDLIEQIDKFKIIEKEEGSKISVVVIHDNSYVLEKIKISKPEVDIKLNYGDYFSEEIHSLILSGLKDNGSGIMLLHGKPGTGKTTYIKYLTSLVKHRDFVYIPNILADQLDSPAFLTFLLSHKNSVLIMEDAERTVCSPGGQRSSGVAGMLNLADGFLTDVLNFMVITTFNTKVEDIDEALTRKGRMLVNYEFEDLNRENALRLLNKLGTPFTSDNGNKMPVRLNEIYLYRDTYINNKEKKEIGYKIPVK